MLEQPVEQQNYFKLYSGQEKLSGYSVRAIFVFKYMADWIVLFGHYCAQPLF